MKSIYSFLLVALISVPPSAKANDAGTFCGNPIECALLASTVLIISMTMPPDLTPECFRQGREKAYPPPMLADLCHGQLANPYDIGPKHSAKDYVRRGVLEIPTVTEFMQNQCEEVFYATLASYDHSKPDLEQSRQFKYFLEESIYYCEESEEQIRTQLLIESQN